MLTHNCTNKSRHLLTYRHRHLQRPSTHTLIHTHFHIHVHSRHFHTLSHTFKLSYSHTFIHTPTQTTHSHGQTYGGACSLTYSHAFTTLQIHIHTHNFHICTLMHTPWTHIGTGCFTYSQSHKHTHTHWHRLQSHGHTLDSCLIPPTRQCPCSAHVPPSRPSMQANTSGLLLEPFSCSLLPSAKFQMRGALHTLLRVLSSVPTTPCNSHITDSTSLCSDPGSLACHPNSTLRIEGISSALYA